MDHEVAASYFKEATRSLRGYKRLAEDALKQLRDEDFAYAPDPNSNSIAIVLQHVAGNLRSRWKDFLTSDGEKPDRDRDREFEPGSLSRAELMQAWETGWDEVFRTLDSLQPEDLGRTVYIRKQPHTVMQAIQRQLLHNAYHVGQIVYLAKHIRGADWVSLSVPKGKSAEFNAMTLEERKVKARDWEGGQSRL